MGATEVAWFMWRPGKDKEHDQWPPPGTGGGHFLSHDDMDMTQAGAARGETLPAPFIAGICRTAAAPAGPGPARAVIRWAHGEDHPAHGAVDARGPVRVPLALPAGGGGPGILRNPGRDRA
jgi:hypothetical protein